MASEFERIALHQTTVQARTWAQKNHPDCPANIRVEWSNRMTTSAGLAFCSRNLIKLSGPIFLDAVEKDGLAQACQKVWDTMLHEIAHLIARDGHGIRWVKAMIALGLDPEEHRYHNMRYGHKLNGGDDFHKWQDVSFVDKKGQKRDGYIRRLNAKRATVMVGQTKWYVPYGMLSKR